MLIHILLVDDEGIFGLRKEGKLEFASAQLHLLLLFVLLEARYTLLRIYKGSPVQLE